MKNNRTFIQNLPLKIPEYQMPVEEELGFEMVQDIPGENPSQGFVNNKSLISFVAGISHQAQQDVLNSTLLAQLYADHVDPEGEDLMAWYQAYIKVLKNVGWTVEGIETATFDSTTNLLDMKNAILEILAEAIGGQYLPLISKTLEVFKELTDSDHKLLVFENNSHTLSKGNFQIGVVDETAGVLSMALGAIVLTTSEEIRKILLFSSAKDESEISYHSIKCTLNSAVYGEIREDILKKLGNNSSSFIASLPDLGSIAL